MFFETFDTTQVGQTLFCGLKELKTPKPVCFWDVRTRNNLFFKFLKIAIIRIFDIYPSFFDQFSINFRSFLNVSWDLLGFIENPWNCIEKLYRDHPSRIHQTKKKLAFRVKTTQNSTLNKLQTRTLCSGWFSRFLIFSKKVIFLLNCVNSGSNFRSQLRYAPWPLAQWPRSGKFVISPT